jgi:hypothetical protein
MHVTCVGWKSLSAPTARLAVSRNPRKYHAGTNLGSCDDKYNRTIENLILTEAWNNAQHF